MIRGEGLDVEDHLTVQGHVGFTAWTGMLHLTGSTCTTTTSAASDWKRRLRGFHRIPKAFASLLSGGPLAGPSCPSGPIKAELLS